MILPGGNHGAVFLSGLSSHISSFSSLRAVGQRLVKVEHGVMDLGVKVVMAYLFHLNLLTKAQVTL